jgi:hypothetical protein
MLEKIIRLICAQRERENKISAAIYAVLPDVVMKMGGRPTEGQN